MGCFEISLGDTIGVATPGSILNFVLWLTNYFCPTKHITFLFLLGLSLYEYFPSKSIGVSWWIKFSRVWVFMVTSVRNRFTSLFLLDIDLYKYFPCNSMGVSWWIKGFLFAFLLWEFWCEVPGVNPYPTLGKLIKKIIEWGQKYMLTSNKGHYSKASKDGCSFMEWLFSFQPKYEVSYAQIIIVSIYIYIYFFSVIPQMALYLFFICFFLPSTQGRLSPCLKLWWLLFLLRSLLFTSMTPMGNLFQTFSYLFK